jgi:hypothetical protein
VEGSNLAAEILGCHSIQIIDSGEVLATLAYSKDHSEAHATWYPYLIPSMENYA